MEEYCPCENLGVMLDVLSCGGFRGMMSEHGLGEGEQRFNVGDVNGDFDYLANLYPKMSKEDRARIMYFDEVRISREERDGAEDLFKYFPEIPESKHGEEWSLAMMERRGEIEKGIRENLAKHVGGCNDCYTIYLDYLLESAKFSKEFDSTSADIIPEHLKDLMGDRMERNIAQRVSDSDSELLNLL